MPSHVKKEHTISQRGAYTFFLFAIFVQGLKHFSIGLRNAVSTETCCIYTALQISIYTRKIWYNARGPPGPDVSAQTHNTSDSGGFLICLILKASML